jgi:hypothetical protein
VPLRAPAARAAHGVGFRLKSSSGVGARDLPSCLLPFANPPNPDKDSEKVNALLFVLQKVTVSGLLLRSLPRPDCRARRVQQRSRALRPRAPPPALSRRPLQHPSQPSGPFSGRPWRPLPHIAALLCRRHMPHGAFRAPPSIGNAKAAAPTGVATRRIESWRRPGQATTACPVFSLPGLCHTVAACPLRVDRACQSVLHRRDACRCQRQRPGSTQGELLAPPGLQAASVQQPTPSSQLSTPLKDVSNFTSPISVWTPRHPCQVLLDNLLSECATSSLTSRIWA